MISDSSLWTVQIGPGESIPVRPSTAPPVWPIRKAFPAVLEQLDLPYEHNSMLTDNPSRVSSQLPNGPHLPLSWEEPS